MKEFPPALPHGPIEEVFPNVFVVRGSIKMAPLVTVCRNMIVVRDGTELTLYNAVRLSETGEKELLALGEVTHLGRIGAFHTIDEPYYMDRFKPTYWAQEGQRKLAGACENISEGDAAPGGGTFFEFRDITWPESAVLLSKHGGVLITCDSVQNFVDLTGCSPVGKFVTKMMGFQHPSHVGKPWRKEMGKSHGVGALRANFERLLEKDFSHLASGHGPVSRDHAKTNLAKTLARVF